MEYFQFVESQNYFELVESQNYYPAQNIHSFKLRIFNTVAVCLYLAHSYLSGVFSFSRVSGIFSVS